MFGDSLWGSLIPKRFRLGPLMTRTDLEPLSIARVVVMGIADEREEVQSKSGLSRELRVDRQKAKHFQRIPTGTRLKRPGWRI